MVRWFSRFAVTSSASRTMPRTPSRRRSSSWPAARIDQAQRYDRPVAPSGGPSRGPAGSVQGRPPSGSRAESRRLRMGASLRPARLLSPQSAPRRSESLAGSLPAARDALLPGGENQRGSRVAVEVAGRDHQRAALEGSASATRSIESPRAGLLPRAAGYDLSGMIGRRFREEPARGRHDVFGASCVISRSELRSGCNEYVSRSPRSGERARSRGWDPSGDESRDFLSGLSENLVTVLRDVLRPPAG